MRPDQMDALAREMMDLAKVLDPILAQRPGAALRLTAFANMMHDAAAVLRGSPKTESIRNGVILECAAVVEHFRDTLECQGKKAKAAKPFVEHALAAVASYLRSVAGNAR